MAAAGDNQNVPQLQAAGHDNEPAPTMMMNPAAAAAPNGRPLATLDPRLFMAARRGNRCELKELLQLEDEGEKQQGTQDGTSSIPAALPADAFISVEEVRNQGHDTVAPSTPPPSPRRDEDGVTMEGDTLLHVVAASGDAQDFLCCARMIVRYNQKKNSGNCMAVLQGRNHRGDTPLHCAAGAGNASMISCLVRLAGTTGEAAARAFVQTQNEDGETALHQAIRATKNMLECIDKLVAMDPGLASIPHASRASPLYLAISLGKLEIAKHLLDRSEGNLSYFGPDGRNVLHAAVSRGRALEMVLGWLRLADREQLLWQLTSERDRHQKGSTPLHLAASLDWWDSYPVQGYLSRWFPQVWTGSMSATEQLVDANISMVYQADDEGSYPIHVAAWCGSLGVVKMLLDKCPDCATLRDGNGRTFVHVAAEEGRRDVVELACGTMPPPQQLFISSILNAQDKNGDTALHRAVRAGNVAVFNCLFRNQQVVLDVPNKDGLTPIDLSWSMIPAGLRYAFNPGNVVDMKLAHAGAPYSGGRPELFRERHTQAVDADKESQKYTHATQAMSIVAVLIATVTFQSAFTMPGGYRPDGTPALAGSYAFDAFVLADISAFICSSLATFNLVYAGLPSLDISMRNKRLKTSAALLNSAQRSFVAAFALALYLVMAPFFRKAAVCAITFTSLFWGNTEAWRICCVVNTIRARTRLRPFLARPCARILKEVLVHFGLYILIFGLPAIW